MNFLRDIHFGKNFLENIFIIISLFFSSLAVMANFSEIDVSKQAAGTSFFVYGVSFFATSIIGIVKKENLAAIAIHSIFILAFVAIIAFSFLLLTGINLFPIQYGMDILDIIVKFFIFFLFLDTFLVIFIFCYDKVNGRNKLASGDNGEQERKAFEKALEGRR